MATNNNQETTNPPPSSPLTLPSKSPLLPRRKRNNCFSRDVHGVLSSSSMPQIVVQTGKSKQPPLAAAEKKEEEEALPKQDQSETVFARHGPTILPPVPDDDEQDSIEDEFDLLSLEHKAAEELYKLPKSGESYDAVKVDVKRIEKRLKYLSKNFDPRQASPRRIIFQGREIADSVSFLMIDEDSSSKVTELVGLKAHRAVSLALQAEMMIAKASELLYQSQEMLEFAYLS